MVLAQFRLLIITLSVALVAVACGGGSDTTDDSRDAGSTEQDQSTQDQSTQNDAELVADYPQELVLPGSRLTESGTELEASGLRTITVWRISADVEDILNFYEGAFDRLDVLGEPQRVELGDFGSLTFGDADSGPASVTVDTTDDGDRTVTVAYLITAGTTTTQPRDDDDSDATDDGDTASPAAPIITSDADDLLLKDDDLPQRTWFSSDSQGLVVEFADATAALFSSVQCQGLDELVFNLEASGPAARDSESRIFRTGGGFNFGRIMTGVAVFNSVADADRAFANSRDVLSGAQIAACFASGVAEAQSEAQRVGASLNASLGDPDFLLQRAAGQQAHIEGGAAGISINVDLQIHTFQRANVVALFSTVISNDATLVAAIPQILCTFEQRVLGSSRPGGQDCLESSVASPPAAGNDNGTPTPPPPPDDDDGGTPPPPPPSDDDDDGSGGGAILGSGGHPIPPELLFPGGPGIWNSVDTSEGVLFSTVFNGPVDTIEEILAFYQSAFTALGAPTVTNRIVTPLSGELAMSGPGGKGTVEVFGSSNSTKSIGATFVQFN